MKRFDKTDKNIMISFAIVMLLVLVLGTLSAMKMAALSNLTQRFYEHPFVVTTATHKIQTHLVSMHRYMKDVLLSEDEDELSLALKRVAEDEKIIYKEYDTIFQHYLGDKNEISRSYELFSDWKAKREAIVTLIRENRRAEAVVMNKTLTHDYVIELNKSVKKLIDFAHNKANGFMKDAEDSKNFLFTTIILIVIVILMLTTLIMVFLLKNLKRLETLRQKEEQSLFQESRVEQMGEMVSMIAHQWRQPLSSISAIVASLEVKQALNTYDPKEFSQLCAKISEITQYLSGTIDDFRDFYKPQKKSVHVTLDKLVSRSLSIIQSSLEKDNIEIMKEFHSKNSVEVYENELMQVVLNLLKNAHDNFREKEIKAPYIKVTTGDKTISVLDNGGGVPEEILEKIFDPYFSTKNEKNGTGLGLYMSKTIVEEHHGGTLEVENIAGGVCFTIRLKSPD